MPNLVSTETKSEGNVRLPAAVTRLRSALTRGLVLLGNLVESHFGACLAALILLYLVYAIASSHDQPLWHDELFTFYLARIDSVHALLFENRAVDLNPPLSYLLTHWSFACFGVSTLACRLPEIAGFSAALLGVALFTGRRVNAACGLLAAALLLSSKAGELSIQARPYGLLMGLTALALVAWQRSHETHSKSAEWTANALLWLSLSALLLSHVFGLFCWGALLAGEAAAVYETRRVNLQRTMALLLPLAAILLYGPMVHIHNESVFPQAFQPSGNDIFEFYIGHIDRELVCLWLAALIVVLTAGRSWLRGSSRFGLTMPEWIAVAILISGPLVLILWLMLHHGAFFDRYGISACLGIAILFAVFFGWWSGRRPGALAIAALLAVLISSRVSDAFVALAHPAVLRHPEPQAASSGLLERLDPALPLVDASGLTFLEMQTREPPTLLDRTVFLTSHDDSLRYAHATIFDGMPQEAALFQLRGAVVPFDSFIRNHRTFYVLGDYNYPEDWLLRKLQDDGATLIRLPDVPASYRSHELYRVTLPR